MTDVYITASGTYLPNAPVDNETMADFIGLIDDQSDRLRKFVLRRNGIATRYYALDRDGKATHSNAAMAAGAVRAAFDHAGVGLERLDLLSTATAQGDLLVPGHASSVHGELACQPIEIANFQSVCASSMMALRAAWLGVKADEKQAAVAVGSEATSRWLRASFYRDALPHLKTTADRMSAEFLRWTLSDGAGALLLQPQPGDGLSLRIDRMKTVSFANKFPACMYAGAPVGAQGDLLNSWACFGDPETAARSGAMILLQDMPLLKDIFVEWVAEIARLADAGWVDMDKVDWMLCHYSAESLRTEIAGMMKASNVLVPLDRWFSNLRDKGNTGSAAIFVMVDEFLKSGRAKKGDTAFCIIPESGRALISFMHFTVV